MTSYQLIQDGEVIGVIDADSEDEVLDHLSLPKAPDAARITIMELGTEPTA